MHARDFIPLGSSVGMQDGSAVGRRDGRDGREVDGLKVFGNVG